MKALSRIFRGKLKDALRGTACYERIPAKAWKQEWVVHSEPVGSGLGALKYLAPYIFRVAISNNRILKLENDRVTFRYRDTETGVERLPTLEAEDFIHRFLQHVLPKGFVKVRYYGIFSSGLRKPLAALRQKLKANTSDLPAQPETRDEKFRPTEVDPSTHSHLCPVCGRPMQPDSLIPASGLSPP